ncbi:MAG: hypothetical protein LUG56_09670 [Lachnospiraceae bacterium]|nr:hypothetical protein [Lachnospiraceae bacterium]
MKKMFLPLFLSLFLSLAFLSVVPGLAAEGQLTDAAAAADGWNGTQYYQNGTAVTGFMTIDGLKYYFDETGNLVTGWKTISGKKYYFAETAADGSALGAAFSKGMHAVDGATYYFTSDGYIKTSWWYKSSNGNKYYFNAKGIRVTGIQKIKKKYYYFKSSGVLLKKTKKIGGTTYYIDSNGYLEAYKKGSKYYNPNGKKKSAQATTSFKTLLRAKAVVAKITTSKMSKSQKLKVCFDWVVNRPYRIYRNFHKTSKSSWITTYANDHFLREGGECHADGAAMAYLAKAIGYTNV